MRFNHVLTYVDENLENQEVKFSDC